MAIHVPVALQIILPLFTDAVQPLVLQVVGVDVGAIAALTPSTLILPLRLPWVLAGLGLFRDSSRRH